MARFQRDETFAMEVSQPQCPLLTLKSFESGPSSGKAGRLCGQELGGCCLLQRVALEFFLCVCERERERDVYMSFLKSAMKKKHSREKTRASHVPSENTPKV